MLGVFADDHHAALALDDLALLANGFDRGTNLHAVFLHSYGRTKRPILNTLTLAAPRNAATGQVVRRKLNRDLVARINADEVHTHLSRNMCHDPVPAGELHLEHRVGKSLNDRAFHFNDVTFGQVRIPPCR